MFKSYLKLAWRNIWRNKAFSITNLSGLTIGMTCTMLIFLWVKDELNWNKFHTDHQNIYQLMVNRDFNGEITTDKSVPFPLADELKRNFPQVKYASIDNYGSDIVLKYNETIIKKRALNVSQDEVLVSFEHLTKLECLSFPTAGPHINPYTTSLGRLLIQAIQP